MNLKCGTWSQVLKVHATFNLGLHNFAIYLITQVVMGPKQAKTRHGPSGLPLSGLATGLPHYTGAGSLPCALRRNASQM